MKSRIDSGNTPEERRGVVEARLRIMDKAIRVLEGDLSKLRESLVAWDKESLNPEMQLSGALRTAVTALKTGKIFAEAEALVDDYGPAFNQAMSELEKFYDDLRDDGYVALGDVRALKKESPFPSAAAVDAFIDRLKTGADLMRRVQVAFDPAAVKQGRDDRGGRGPSRLAGIPIAASSDLDDLLMELAPTPAQKVVDGVSKSLSEALTTLETDLESAKDGAVRAAIQKFWKRFERGLGKSLADTQSNGSSVEEGVHVIVGQFAGALNRMSESPSISAAEVLDACRKEVEIFTTKLRALSRDI